MTSIADVVAPISPPSGGIGVRYFYSATAPTGAVTGDIWLDTATNQWKRLGSSGWVVVGTGATLPVATRQGQVIVAGTGPNFPWTAGDVDCGRI